MKNEKRLKAELRIKGMTIKSFAEKIGVHPVTISRWMNRKAPVSPAGVLKMKEHGISDESIAKPYDTLSQDQVSRMARSILRAQTA